MAVKPLYQDPFSPLLFSSEELAVSPEQKLYIRKVLDLACSDSKFAQKAYDAITYILTAGSVEVPVISNLTPSSATLGGPNFTLTVTGTGFTPESVIVFNESHEVTTFVSATQVTTGVDMSTAGTPVVVPVYVLSPEGVPSNVWNFEFQDSITTLSATKPTLGQPKSTVTPAKPVEVKK